VTQIGVAPVIVGKGVVTGVVTGVGMGVGTVGKGVKSIFKKEGSKITIEEPVVLEVPSASVSQPVPVSAVQLGQNGAGSGSAMASPQRSTSPPVSNITLPGTLRVEVIEGSDLMAADGDPVRPYVIASIGEAEHKTKHVSKTNTPLWNESFLFNPVGPETSILHIEVFDHKTIGKDKPLGDADVEIWKHLQPNSQSLTVSSVVKVDLRQGFGKITLRLEFEMNAGRAASISSGDRAFGSKSLFSLRNVSRPTFD